MAQHSNEHLTIAELSAYLDKELAPEELALCDAHIQSCQLCRAALADLRLTSALLSSMPQVAVPRSFTLPTNLLTLPETPAATTGNTLKPRRSSSSRPYIWKRTMNTLSTLVAILGLLFFLAGALSSLPHGGASGTSSASAGVQAPNAATNAPQYNLTPTPSDYVATPTQDASPGVKATDITGGKISPTPSYPQSTSTSNVPATSTPGVSSTSAAEPSVSQFPAALDLSQASGRLTIGGSLLFLGILGAVITRLFTRSTRR